MNQNPRETPKPGDAMLRTWFSATVSSVQVDLDEEIQDHLRTCIECEVVMNARGQPRILACGWWYEKGIMPPWPLPDAVPGPISSRG